DRRLEIGWLIENGVGALLGSDPFFFGPLERFDAEHSPSSAPVVVRTSARWSYRVVPVPGARTLTKHHATRSKDDEPSATIRRILPRAPRNRLASRRRAD